MSQTTNPRQKNKLFNSLISVEVNTHESEGWINKSIDIARWVITTTNYSAGYLLHLIFVLQASQTYEEINQRTSINFVIVDDGDIHLNEAIRRSLEEVRINFIPASNGAIKSLIIFIQNVSVILIIIRTRNALFVCQIFLSEQK